MKILGSCQEYDLLGQCTLFSWWGVHLPVSNLVDGSVL